MKSQNKAVIFLRHTINIFFLYQSYFFKWSSLLQLEVSGPNLAGYLPVQKSWHKHSVKKIFQASFRCVCLKDGI